MNIRRFCKKPLIIIALVVNCHLTFAQEPALIDSLIEVAERSKSDYEPYSIAISDIAYAYYNTKPDSAIYYMYMILPRSYARKDTNDLGYFHAFIGVCHKMSGEYDSAIFHLEKSLFFRKLEGYEQGVAASHNNLGNVYKLKGNYDQSAFHFFESVKIFESLNDEQNLGEAHSNLGELYIQLEDFDKAKKHFNKSKNYYSKAGLERNNAWIYSDLGSLYEKMNLPDSAIYYYTLSANIWKSFDRPNEYSSCLISLAQLQFGQGDENAGIKLLNEAEQNFLSLQNDYGLSETYLHKGRHFKRKKNYPEAIKYFNRSLRKSNYLQANGLLVSVYYELYEASKYSGSESAALHYLESYQHLKDSLFGIEQEQIRLRLETQFEVVFKEQKIRELQDSAKIQQLEFDQTQLENERNKLANRQQKMGIYLLSFCIATAVMLTIVLYRRNKVKARLNDELHKALQEREALLREIHHRVKNNLQIVSSLLNLQSNYSDKKSAQEILKASQDRINSMSILHENLYKSEHLNNILFRDYVKNLTSHLSTSFDINNKNIHIEVYIEDFSLDMDFLVPCGLILNELITNSMKYAFDQKNNGIIQISAILNNGLCEITYTDNGIGMSTNIDPLRNNSLGLRLVHGLVRQMKGEIKFNQPEVGVQIKFNFKVNEA